MTKLYTIIIISALSAMSCGGEKPESRSDQNKRIEQTITPVLPLFEGKRAFEYLRAQTDFGPRVPGSQEHAQCLNYLHTEMKKFADVVSLQKFDHRGYDGKIINMTNIISSFNLNATTRILLLAHWDSRPRADQDPDRKNQNKPILGANDGASGIAVLMEIAHHLKTNVPQVGIDMLFTDGEDYGKEGDTKNYLLGAQHFAKNLPVGFRPSFGILLDLVGDRELEIRKERYSLNYAPDIIDLVWSTAKELGITQFTDDLQGWVTDDHLPLNNAGIRTINLIDFNYPDQSNRFWHTLEDTPDKCSPESLEAVGMVLIHLIYHYSPQ